MRLWPHKHIHSLKNFSIEDYKSVFELADKFQTLKCNGTKKIKALEGSLVTSLFFEPSTRTRNSFEWRQKGFCRWANLFSIISSLVKGESVIDAITYSAMGADISY